MTPRTSLALWLLTVGLCWATASLHPPKAKAEEGEVTSESMAQADRAREEASKHFRRGVELFQESAYRAALVEFERAYEILPDYRLHYNIGQTKLQLQDYLAAMQSYERYLIDGGASVPPKRRQEVERQLELLRERVARLAISANENDAKVYVDDQLVGVTPLAETIAVNVGRHRIVVRTDSGAQATELVDVAGGDLLEVELTLEAPEVAVVVQGEENGGMSRLQKLGIAGMAGGGALVVGSAVTAVITASAQKDFDSAVSTGDVSAARDHQNKAETSALITDVLGATGLVVLTAGVVAWLLADDDEQPPPQEASVRFGIGPGSVLVEGTF